MHRLYFIFLLQNLVIVVISKYIPFDAAAPPWRTSMDVCWTNASCVRALLVSHGGAPDYTTRPYDSFEAFKMAYNDGTDAIKGDFRVTRDNIGMVMHSSPIELYESVDCAGKRVENMTAEDAMKCKMFPTNQTFISVPILLDWAKEKVIVMLCVKEKTDIARAISTLIENNATDRAFLEIRTNDLAEQVLNAKPPGWNSVYYLAEMGNAADIDRLLSSEFKPLLSRLFTFEFDPSWSDWGINISDTMIKRLHPQGIRSLAATEKTLPSKKSQEKLWETGFDIVYTYGTAAGVQARTTIDIQRGVIPPKTMLVFEDNIFSTE